MQEQLDRIEKKIDGLIKDTSKNTTEITWIKSIGGTFLAAFAWLFSRHLGGS